jgi:hypothetical protein
VESYELKYNARVSADLSLDRYASPVISVRTHPSAAWDLTMSAYQARKLARTLTKVANFVDPPKPRK